MPQLRGYNEPILGLNDIGIEGYNQVCVEEFVD
jgi:hypothetical protein